MARPIANPITYGTLSGNVPMSDLDTSFGALFTTGFNDSSLGWVNYAADTGVANAYVVTLSVTPSSYTAGMCVAFTPQNSNTGASTINVNALGTKVIVNRANVALTGGEIILNKTLTLVYDGTSFRIQGFCGLTYNPAANPGNVNLNCAGYDAVSASILYTATSPTTALQLQNLGYGIPVSVSFINGTGSNILYGISCTDPTGVTTNSSVTFVVNTLAGGTRTVFQSGSTITAQTINANSALSFKAVSYQTAVTGVFLAFS